MKAKAKFLAKGIADGKEYAVLLNGAGYGVVYKVLGFAGQGAKGYKYVEGAKDIGEAAALAKFKALIGVE